MMPRTRKVFLNSRPQVPDSMTTRPRCRCCGKPRGYAYESMLDRIDLDTDTEHRRYTGRVTWVGMWYGENLFCSLRCCERFALACAKAGMVMKREVSR